MQKKQLQLTLWQRISYRIINFIASTGLQDEHKKMGANLALKHFLSFSENIEGASVLELGTKRHNPQIPTIHHHWVPEAKEFLGTDCEAGMDVDIVADLHCLADVVGDERFDIIISCSTLEHIKYPHLAAHQIMRSLKIGGTLFIQTHQTLPYHGYPHDYFRYSIEALRGLFGEKMGMKIEEANYEFPARICSPQDTNACRVSTYINVCLLAKKIKQTPKEFQYEL
ncbi:MAG: methyltransferase domain-containing protein [Oligoflexia bacterium]|nr:methyltransferase domain-containing protein [Oligoflexia bacterium]